MYIRDMLNKKTNSDPAVRIAIQHDDVTKDYYKVWHEKFFAYAEELRKEFEKENLVNSIKELEAVIKDQKRMHAEYEAAISYREKRYKDHQERKFRKHHKN